MAWTDTATATAAAAAVKLAQSLQPETAAALLDAYDAIPCSGTFLDVLLDACAAVRDGKHS